MEVPHLQSVRVDATFEKLFKRCVISACVSASGPVFAKRITGTKEVVLGTDVHNLATVGFRGSWSPVPEEKGDNLERGITVGTSLFNFLTDTNWNVEQHVLF